MKIIPAREFKTAQGRPSIGATLFGWIAKPSVVGACDVCGAPTEHDRCDKHFRII